MEDEDQADARKMSNHRVERRDWSESGYVQYVGACKCLGGGWRSTYLCADLNRRFKVDPDLVHLIGVCIYVDWADPAGVHSLTAAEYSKSQLKQPLKQEKTAHG
jgi:hypothetical protein